MKKTLLLLALQITFYSFSQNVNFKVNSACFSNNSINYIVGINDVQLIYPSPKTADTNTQSENNYYPNPVIDKLFFQNFEKMVAVEIYNELGQIIATKPVVDNYVDLSDIKSGLYLIIPKNIHRKPFKILKK